MWLCTILRENLRPKIRQGTTHYTILRYCAGGWEIFPPPLPDCPYFIFNQKFIESADL